MNTPDFTPHADELLGHNTRFADDFPNAGVPGRPERNLAVVTCMDCRLDPREMLGLAKGDAHIMRNAGGVLTDDMVRSLVMSQRALGTREVMIVHHTNCGMEGVDNEGFVDHLEQETGVRPDWGPEGFDDVVADVRAAIQRLRDSPFLLHKDHIRGFVYDVDTGRLNEV
jgi:carbonic anhydrase